MAAAPALTVAQIVQRLIDDPVNYRIPAGISDLNRARVEARVEQIRRANDAANMADNLIRAPRIHDNNDDDAGRHRKKSRRSRKSRKSRKSKKTRKSRKSRKSRR